MWSQRLPQLRSPDRLTSYSMGHPGPTRDGLLRSRMKPADRSISASGSRDQMDIGRSGFQSRQNSRLDSDSVIHRGRNPLVATEVTFRGLYGDVAQKKLNLLQFASGGAAEPSATSTEIVRREFANANLGGELLDDVPDELFRHSFAPNLAGAAYTPEETTRLD